MSGAAGVRFDLANLNEREALLRVSFQRVLCVPSQNGWLRVCLQPHSHSFSALVTTNFTGVNSVTLCDPSQKGWLFDLPQRHHQ
jgi:hypothetical protein